MGATRRLANVRLLAEGPSAHLTYINVTQMTPVFVFNFVIFLLCVALIQFASDNLENKVHEHEAFHLGRRVGPLRRHHRGRISRICTAEAQHCVHHGR
jgi:hypothetical protein